MIAVAAKEAGLSSPSLKNIGFLHEVIVRLDEVQTNYIFTLSPDLVLVAFRIEVELHLRTLAHRVGMVHIPGSTRQLLRSLLCSGTFTRDEYGVLKDLIKILDRAASGASVEADAAVWVKEVGPSLLTALEKHLVPPDLSVFGL